MERALIAFLFQVCLLRMDFVDSLRDDGGVVQDLDIQGYLRAWLSRLGLGNVEMPNSGGCCSPDGTENRILLAVQVAKIG